jgi:hypothetical protein
MPLRPARPAASCGALLLLLLTALIAAPARGQEPAETLADRLLQVKRIQRNLLMRKARERIGEAQRLRLGGAEPARGERKRPTGEADRVRYRPEARGDSPRIHGGAALAPNVRANNPTGDDSNASQNEPSVAVWGDYVLVAWNDLPRWDFLGSLQGYAYSTDGGVSFVDGGEIPAPGDTVFWTSDPVVTVNEKTGEFYYCGMLETLENLVTGETQNGVGVARGRFSGGTFVWDTPWLARLEPSTLHFIDKPWVVADSSSDNVYISYSDFTFDSNWIAFQRSLNGGITWLPPLTLSSPAGAGSVQGSRPVVGPNGEIYAVWKELGSFDPGSDFLRMRRSTDHGASFGPEQTAATFFDNYGTGAPGFNRDRGVALPAIAVDRTIGPNRGRLYVTWNESLNWYDDTPRLGTGRPEVEDNDLPSGATPFTPGEALTGAFGDTADVDYFAFTASQGTSYIFWADNVPLSIYSMRLICSDSQTLLAYSGHPELPLDGQGNQGIMVWTAPSAGTYYVRMRYFDEGGDLGPYRVRTGVVSPGPGDRGRDQRDVFVAWSDNGSAWSTPVRVNEDPPYFDNWLPEVGVSSFGTAFVIWYDWRDAPPSACGGSSHVYVARSEDAGPTWSTLGQLTDVPTAWTLVSSNLAPNQGDYLALFANEHGVYACWTDGRGGSPDIYSTVVTASPETLQVAARAEAGVSSVTVTWQFRVGRVVHATLYRQEGDGAPLSLGLIQSDGTGYIRYLDPSVSRGTRYTYSLGIIAGSTEFVVGRVSAMVLAGRLLVRPNPLSRSTTVQYDVPAPGGRVELVVYDLQGRVVRTLVREIQAPGSHQAVWNVLDNNGTAVPAGIYLLRLTHPGKTVSQRVSVVP